MEIQNLMIDIFYSLVLITFIVRTIKNTLYHSFYWQLKEYRLDRYIAYLRSPLGKKMLFFPITLFKWLLIMAIIFTFLLFILSSDSNLFIYFNMMRLLFIGYWSSIILEGIINLYQLIKRKWIVPKITLKVSLILFSTLLIQLTPLLGLDWSFLYLVPILDKTLPIMVFFMVMMANVPTYIYRKIVVYIAGKKIRKLKNLTVIGITGSFGKTSTKEFLTSMLSSKYKVAKTLESINTDLGIAKYILKEIGEGHDLFVVEMGAYKRGEIAQICKIVEPKIGIITGVNQQHIELFGSIENTMKTKFELITNLKKNGFAVFNNGNPYCKKMMNWCKTQRPDLRLWAYQQFFEKNDLRKIRTKEENLVVAYSTAVAPDYVSFKLQYQDKVVNCEAKLAGSQNIENILAASCVVLELGFKIDEVKNSIKYLKAPEKTMKLLPKFGKLATVDDTFNTNPDGVMAALDYMKVYKGVKILILTPLIELGRESENIHKQMGKYAANICDLVLLTNPNFKNSMLAGANLKDGNNKVRVVDYFKAVALIDKFKDREGVLVFEGKEAGKILQEVRSRK